MTGLLLDTNVLSELTRPAPNATVIRFLEAAQESWLSVVTVHELAFGLRLLPSGRRQAALAEAVAGLLDIYGDRVLAVREVEAQQAAELRAEAQTVGRVLHLADALIAATAAVHGLTLATRNVDDFAFAGIALMNPWQTA